MYIIYYQLSRNQKVQVIPGHLPIIGEKLFFYTPFCFEMLLLPTISEPNGPSNRLDLKSFYVGDFELAPNSLS